MSATIYYFSATGNSLTIAQRIAQGLEDCDVRSMAVGSPEESVGGPGHGVGFVFPVYYCGMPRLVAQFARALDILPGTYCFAFATYGAAALDTLGMLEDILKEKGAKLSYGIGARMPGNYIVEYQAFPAETVERLTKAALISADQAAAEIAQRKSRPVRRRLKLFSRVVNRKTLYKNIPGWDEPFHVSEKCIGCRLCSEVCPVSNIRIVKDRPVWQHHCERCVACIQWCPVEAIEYGQKTVGRRRYRFPGLSAAAITAGSLGPVVLEKEEQHA
jgi:ferredoxin